MRKIRMNVSADGDLLGFIKRKTGITSNQDVTNSAIALLAWAIKEKGSGNIVCSVNNSSDKVSYKEIEMPILEKL